MLARRVEEASLNAWPAIQQMLFDGWLLRFSEGYTKRANSVNPLYGSQMDIDHKVAVCESLYDDRGLRTIFRLTPFCVRQELDCALAARGYARIDPTQVLHLDLASSEYPVPPDGALEVWTLEDWLAQLCRLRGESLSHHSAHRAIIEGIPSNRILAVWVDRDRAVACGLGVLEGPYVGLFDLITDAEQRNRGYGTALLGAILSWAQGIGARHAYLQVMASNAPARHVYGKLGFRELYSYWYRVRSLTRTGKE